VHTAAQAGVGRLSKISEPSAIGCQTHDFSLVFIAA
jgi:hypothetical protein